MTKIDYILQRGDPEEMLHLFAHISNLMPCVRHAVTIEPEHLTSKIDHIIQRRDPDEVLHLFAHVSNLMSCKRLTTDPVL